MLTSAMTLTSSPSSPQHGDGDGGSGGRRGGVEELRRTTTPGKAINRKRGGGEPILGVPAALIRDDQRLALLDVCLHLRLLTRTGWEKLKQQKWSKVTDRARIRLCQSPPFSGAVVDISLDMTPMVLMVRLTNTNNTGGVSQPCTTSCISPLCRLPSFLDAFGWHCYSIMEGAKCILGEEEEDSRYFLSPVRWTIILNIPKYH
jgi:hypothetical protein